MTDDMSEYDAEQARRAMFRALAKADSGRRIGWRRALADAWRAGLRNPIRLIRRAAVYRHFRPLDRASTAFGVPRPRGKLTPNFSDMMREVSPGEYDLVVDDPVGEMITRWRSGDGAK